MEIELKDGFIEHRGDRQIWFHEQILVRFDSVLKTNRNFVYRTPLLNNNENCNASCVEGDHNLNTSWCNQLAHFLVVTLNELEKVKLKKKNGTYNCKMDSQL